MVVGEFFVCCCSYFFFFIFDLFRVKCYLVWWLSSGSVRVWGGYVYCFSVGV